MIYSEDSTEQGKKCEIVIKSETITCIVICSFDRISKDKIVTRKYRLQAKDKTIYDNISPQDIIFKK
jgi:hypothetical protein